MIKIINLLYYDEKRFKNILVFKEIYELARSFSFRFLYGINSLLGIKLKFFRDFYVAEENDVPKALIGLKIIAGAEIKAVITNFILVENSLNIAERLINSVVQKFSAKGVSTFYIHIDKSNSELVDLFLSKVNFRVLSGETFFDAKREYEEYSYRNFIKKMSDRVVPRCLDLHNFLINPNLKFYFNRNMAEFKQAYLSNTFDCGCYIMQNPKTEEIYSFFTLKKTSENIFVLEPYIMSRYATYILDIVEFTNNILARKFGNYELKLHLNKFLTSYDDVFSVLKNSNFEVEKENLILSKDYLKKVKDSIEIRNSSIVFNDINPAY